MYLIYSILMALYFGAAMIASIFYKKGRKWLLGHRGQYKALEKKMHDWRDGQIVWIHAASYGEYEMSIPLLKALKKQNSDIKFVVSFFSPSGYENTRIESPDFYKIYLPLDLFRIQKNYLSLVKPHAFIFIKYEFWFNLMRALQSEHIKYYFVGLHLERDSYLLRKAFKTLTRLIKSADGIYTHSKNAYAILEEKSFKNIEVFGDMRISQVLVNKEEGPISLKWPREGCKCMIYGSVSKYELPYILDIIKKNPQHNHILALHDVEKELMQIIVKAGINPSYISESKNSSSNCLVVDSYGELKYLYRLADVAYVGGGFEKGPHNILEALVFETPVIIGPHIKKFPLAREASKRGFVKVISEIGQLEKQLIKITERDKKIEKAELKKFFDDFATDEQALAEIILK